MSAPDTDIKKQEDHHKAPLLGMGAAVIFGVALIALLGIWVVMRGGDPDGAETQIDGRTGDTEAVQTESAPVEETAPSEGN